jgi:dTDP-4-dehydrorhamnose 3,5-epimerase
VEYYTKIVKNPIQIYRRRWNADGRGKLLEGLRNDDKVYQEDFGQIYVTTILPKTIKAWHLHENQKDRMLLLQGLVRFVGISYEGLHILDFVVSDVDPYLIVIPAGIIHGFQNLGDKEAYIMNIPDKAYNRENPDERRLPVDYYKDFNWNISLDG